LVLRHLRYPTTGHTHQAALKNAREGGGTSASSSGGQASAAAGRGRMNAGAAKRNVLAFCAPFRDSKRANSAHARHTLPRSSIRQRAASTTFRTRGGTCLVCDGAAFSSAGHAGRSRQENAHHYANHPRRTPAGARRHTHIPARCYSRFPHWFKRTVLACCLPRYLLFVHTPSRLTRSHILLLPRCYLCLL